MNTNNFKIYLDNIESEIAKIWPSVPDKNWLDLMSSSVLANLQSDNNLSIDPADLTKNNMAMANLLALGGKRWRPLLMVLCAKSLNSSLDDCYKLTPIIELIHNASLIVDDIEDNSPLRRGKNSAFIEFGIDVALNTSNFAYFAPTICIDNSIFSNDIKLKLYSYYSSALRNLHLGQALDIIWHKSDTKIPSLDEYKTMCYGKTGSLAYLAAVYASIISGKDDLFTASLGNAWLEIALAFQMYDDIANLENASLGKTMGDDLIEGKKSLVLICYAKTNNFSLDSYTATINMIKEANFYNQKKVIASTIKIIRDSGAIDEAKIIAEKQLSYGKELLNRLLKSDEIDFLISMMIGTK